jgi:hypothetical protein
MGSAFPRTFPWIAVFAMVKNTMRPLLFRVLPVAHEKHNFNKLLDFPVTFWIFVCLLYGEIATRDVENIISP